MKNLFRFCVYAAFGFWAFAFVYMFAFKLRDVDGVIGFLTVATFTVVVMLLAIYERVRASS